MNRIVKAMVAGFVVLGSMLLMAPAASACCIPCQSICNQPGVPPSTYCCTGIPVPGDACGLTICGKWLQGQRSEKADLNLSANLSVATAEAGCEQAFPWLAAN